jgi:hypothetical protein
MGNKAGEMNGVSTMNRMIKAPVFVVQVSLNELNSAVSWNVEFVSFPTNDGYNVHCWLCCSGCGWNIYSD